MQASSAQGKRNTSLVKKTFILHLAPHTFTVVHCINIWTNVNSYHHNIVKEHIGHSNEFT